MQHEAVKYAFIPGKLGASRWRFEHYFYERRTYMCILLSRIHPVPDYYAPLLESYARGLAGDLLLLRLRFLGAPAGDRMEVVNYDINLGICRCTKTKPCPLHSCWSSVTSSFPT